MSGNNIKVVCRFRPQNSLEIREGGVPIVDISDEGSSLELKVFDMSKAHTHGHMLIGSSFYFTGQGFPRTLCIW